MASDFTGGGDPARTLALLWRTDDRGGRSGLSVDRIVKSAIEIADSEGLGALSMRRVADALGVGTMSLYTYVPAKAELIDVMVDTVLGEVAKPDAIPAKDWRTALERIASRNWELYHRHPWLLNVGTSRPPLGPNVVDKYETELTPLDGIGLTDIEMDSTLQLVLSHVEATARQSVGAVEAVNSSGMTDEEWWNASAPVLARFTDDSRSPIGSRVGQAFGEEHGAASAPEHNLEFGLARILDGVESLIRSRS
jgi:AcrR family transcriptional regulator